MPPLREALSLYLGQDLPKGPVALCPVPFVSLSVEQCCFQECTVG
jgi:hypothetical protein